MYQPGRSASFVLATWLCLLSACATLAACDGASSDGASGDPVADAAGPGPDGDGAASDTAGSGEPCPAGTAGCPCAKGDVCFVGACVDAVCSTGADGKPDGGGPGGSDADLPSGEPCSQSADCEGGQHCIRRSSGAHECGALPACVVLSGEGLKAWSPEDQECTSCPPCLGDGATGVIWPTTNQNGHCICETQDGWFFDDASDALEPTPCDADGDGWVRDVARGYLSSNDVGLRENARCTVRTIGSFRLVNERGESRDVAVGDVAPPLSVLELFEATAIDEDDEGTGGVLGSKLPVVQTRAFHAAELNGLTKACAGITADYNQNGVSDIEESWSSQPEHEWQLGLLRMSYFVELHEAAFEPGDAGPGRIVIAERRRCGADFPLTYGKGGDAYQTCTRVRPYTYDAEVEAPGYDFGRWSCDATTGSCPPPDPMALAQGGGTSTKAAAHPYCVDPPAPVAGAWTGMNHASQFQCVSFVTSAEGDALEPYERAANATEKTYAKNVCYLSADDALEFGCNADNGAAIEPGVGWSLSLYSAETPGCEGDLCFARGCIPECPVYKALCPGFSTGAAGCSSKGTDGTLVCNSCPETGEPCGAGLKGACASATWYCPSYDGKETPTCGYVPAPGSPWKGIDAANWDGDPPFGADEDCDGFHGDLDISRFVSANPAYNPEPPWEWTMDNPGPASALQDAIVIQAKESYPAYEDDALQAPRRRYLYLGKGTIAGAMSKVGVLEWANLEGTVTIIGGQDEGTGGGWTDDPEGRTTIEGDGHGLPGKKPGVLVLRLSRGSVELKKLNIVATVEPPNAMSSPQHGQENAAVNVAGGIGLTCEGDLADADLPACICGIDSACCTESWDTTSGACWQAAKDCGWCPSLTIEDCTITVEGGGDASGNDFAGWTVKDGEDGAPASEPCSPAGCSGFGCQALNPSNSFLAPEVMIDQGQCLQFCVQEACYKGSNNPFKDLYGLGGVGCGSNGGGHDGGHAQTQLLKYWEPQIGQPGQGNAGTSNEGALGQSGGSGDTGKNGASATKWDTLSIGSFGNIGFIHQSTAQDGTAGGGGGGGGQGGMGVLAPDYMCVLGAAGVITYSCSASHPNNIYEAYGYALHGAFGGGGGGGGCGGEAAPSAGSGGAAIGIQSTTRAITLINTEIDVSAGGGRGGDAIPGGEPGSGGKGGAGFNGFSPSDEAKFEQKPTISGSGGAGGFGGWGGHGAPGLGAPAVCVVLYEQADGGAWEVLGEGSACVKGPPGDNGDPAKCPTTSPDLAAPPCVAQTMPPAPETAKKLSDFPVIRGSGALIFEP